MAALGQHGAELTDTGFDATVLYRFSGVDLAPFPVTARRCAWLVIGVGNDTDFRR
ncbi:hypothetical protein [Streptomyces brasiliensis]|uniref:Uncharacterized protein n=1 Tax=Streptomyces brasiliensis TaxID=1954 RepID=A0A917PEW2_9ACTN|nr:hypothetical protein [Streptomyces brasiliensis]GGJ73680.1 hypothetical protein GCM10010121_100290 [Streptomyces brasiliensis]